MQQCKENRSGLLLLAWRLSCGQWRFFPVVLCLLSRTQRAVLRSKRHICEKPEHLPLGCVLGHGQPRQRIVGVQGLDTALRAAFAAAASPGDGGSSSESDSD